MLSDRMVLITVGGPPGSGTSTVCKLLSERTGYKYVYAGEIFRNLAHERNLSLLEFGRSCEDDPEIDRALDERMLELARSGENMILEGRMTGPLCKMENIVSLKVFIFAEKEVRARRLMERDGGVLKEVIENMEDRESSECKRYEDYYGVDPEDHTHYDIVLDSSKLTPEEVVELIFGRLEGRS